MKGPKAVDEVLSAVPLFSNLGSRELKTIAAAGKHQSFEAGQTIVEEGRTGVGFYLILGGRVEVRRGTKVIATLGEGQFFGEMSVIDGQPRSADVVAVTPTRCFSLSAWSFASLVKAEPRITMGVMKELVRRLRSADSGTAD